VNNPLLPKENFWYSKNRYSKDVHILDPTEGRNGGLNSKETNMNYSMDRDFENLNSMAENILLSGRLRRDAERERLMQAQALKQ